MNKKKYQAPQTNLQELKMVTPILSGSSIQAISTADFENLEDGGDFSW